MNLDPRVKNGYIKLPIVGLLYDTCAANSKKFELDVVGVLFLRLFGFADHNGIVLAMHYASCDQAFASVEHIMRNVNGGHMLRYLHANGASLFFIAVYAHIFRGLYYGSYKEPREVTWIIGMLIYVLMMATAFMGYVLPWGQMSFWGATVTVYLEPYHLLEMRFKHCYLVVQRLIMQP